MDVYEKIVELLNREPIDNNTIFEIIALLEDYSFNATHDAIFDELLEYLFYGDIQCLIRITILCLIQIASSV